MTGETQLAIERALDGDVETLTLRGELDLTNALELQRAVLACQADRVVLDLGELGYLDSAGMRAIDQAHRLFSTQQRVLTIVAPKDSRAGWTLRVAGFPEELVAESIDAAIERSAGD